RAARSRTAGRDRLRPRHRGRGGRGSRAGADRPARRRVRRGRAIVRKTGCLTLNGRKRTRDGRDGTPAVIKRQGEEKAKHACPRSRRYGRLRGDRGSSPRPRSSRTMSPVPTTAREIATGFDLKALPPAFYADPFPYYKALREHEPVKRLPDGSWLLTRYED